MTDYFIPSEYLGFDHKIKVERDPDFEVKS